MNKEYESKKQALDDESDVCFFAIEIFVLHFGFRNQIENHIKSQR